MYSRFPRAKLQELERPQNLSGNITQVGEAIEAERF
jgi:hypothetical protein